MYIDRYIVDYKLCVEIDGIQHFKEGGFHKNLDHFAKAMDRDFQKDNYCLDNGYSMLRIPYDMEEEIIEKYLIYFINCYSRGNQFYFSYKHFYDQIPPTLLQNPNLFISLVPCPLIKIKGSPKKTIMVDGKKPGSDPTYRADLDILDKSLRALGH